MNPVSEIALQRDYYARTAATYEAQHVRQGDEHYLALALLSAMISHFDCRSVLDVGSGTGRCLHYLKARHPNLKVVGIEPSAELRAIGHQAGLGSDELIDGDALALAFPDGGFDLVCEFGVLHHIKTPRAAMAEMLRVARRGIFISDDNHFASGSLANRLSKRLLRRLGLWPLAYWLRTGGKGYGVSEGDGISYAFSVFDHHAYLQQHCSRVLVANTSGGGIHAYVSAPHVALFGEKA